MVDANFFHTAGPVTLSEIAALTGAAITTGNGNAPDTGRSFTNVAPLDRAGPNDISFLDNVKYTDSFAASKAGACFVRSKFSERAPKDMILLVTDEPYYAYALTSRHFYPDTDTPSGVSAQALIAKSAKIGKNVGIESGAVIGEHVEIGDNVRIGANTVIAEHVRIGADSRIGALCSISHAVLGQRVVLHRGIHIGQDGFGFAAGKKGIVKVPQLGRVMIGDDVEIGSGTCIDRGAGPDTIIGQGSKIDNLVQIGHNVQIGKFVVIAAQCGIAGSTHIGDGAMLGGQVGISGHVRIGPGAKLAAQAGIMTDIPAGSTFGGSPAVPARDWHRQTVALTKLIKKKEFSDE